MTRRHLLALVALALATLGAACGGGQTSAGRPVQRSATPGPASRPAARLTWRSGQVLEATVDFEERDQATRGTFEATGDELQMTAKERLTVTAVDGGLATLRAAVTSWRWQRNSSSLLTAALPVPATFTVDRRGETVAADEWPIPPGPPLPGLDLFAAPLPGPASWPRTDGEGVRVGYRVTPEPGATSEDPADRLAWSVRRSEHTRSGQPLTLTGQAQATVSSTYALGHSATLRATREQGTYRRTEQTADGTLSQTGTILVTTTFAVARVR
ncbi:MAG: hypothetical protein ACREOV_04805 [Candidatus Dormibacteraceae bacterium]